MITDASFGRATGKIMLHPVTGENLNLAIIAANGHGYYEAPPRNFKYLQRPGLNIYTPGGILQLL